MEPPRPSLSDDSLVFLATPLCEGQRNHKNSNCTIDLCAPVAHHSIHLHLITFHTREQHMRTRLLAMVLSVGLLPSAAWADVKPHALCGEGMVLQQQRTATIWGTAEKDEEV